jgi:hypothetical protein
MTFGQTPIDQIKIDTRARGEISKLPFFHFVWVKLLMSRKNCFDYCLENCKKRALIPISKVIKFGHMMKWNRAILGRNSTRDNQIQMALKNATNEVDSYYWCPLQNSITVINSFFSAKEGEIMKKLERY